MQYYKEKPIFWNYQYLKNYKQFIRNDKQIDSVKLYVKIYIKIRGVLFKIMKIYPYKFYQIGWLKTTTASTLHHQNYFQIVQNKVYRLGMCR